MYFEYNFVNTNYHIYRYEILTMDLNSPRKTATKVFTSFSRKETTLKSICHILQMISANSVSYV